MPRTYDQYCSVAAALDRLGDRWTLLLLRDLAWYGPNRFTDLKRHNRGIPPALLTERLDRLVDEGVVERHQGSYRLIDPDGQIRNLIDLLSRFGASFLAAMPPSISELEYLARRLTSLHRKTLAEHEAGTVTILMPCSARFACRAGGTRFAVTTSAGRTPSGNRKSRTATPRVAWT